jgi:hypothetical protein
MTGPTLGLLKDPPPLPPAFPTGLEFVEPPPPPPIATTYRARDGEPFVPLLIALEFSE